jgi:hypothetical protein
MRKVQMILIAVVLVTVIPVIAQEPVQESTSELQTENLQRDSERLDKDVADFSTKIEAVVVKYELSSAEGIQVLPYRMDYSRTDEYIEMTRHTFIRRDNTGEVIGLKTKSIKVYMNGETISKIESEITERNYAKSTDERVIIVDPSPKTEDTTDITFTQVLNNQTLVDGKKLGDVKNTTAFPVANVIKRDFYVPHLSFFYYAFQTIGETYQKSSKDTDEVLTEFLKDSVDY